MFLTIITPSFNRGYCLENIYNSLLTKNRSNYEWILIDDGSADNTETLAKKWIEKNEINFKYIKRANGGKTNALVTAFESSILGEYSLVLDSDDFLVSNFYEIIKAEISKMKDNQIGISFLKSDLNGNIIGSEFKKTEVDYAEMYYGAEKTIGDKMFVVRTDVYAKSLVSSFPNEKLIPESVFYINMSKNGQFKCVNKIIYKGDYLADGLSFDVEKLAARNINGFVFEKLLLQKEKLSTIDMIKNEIKYISYSLSAGKSILKILNESNSKIWSVLLLIPSYLLTWKRIKSIKMIRNGKK
ncbi:glycosyltransferase family 2 protein [Chryseobacterium carnipullorum]|uniref:glycosyltransferase family 2 protein n=1 Tax=Chryseobacterium carnipullorum TaxID=1124835 RepID=UPI000E976F1C|nr:glycosyltransferase family 2 protein [Chryseobacterium carnipullorum]HBV14168.1 hypothetical protein [Chryseobacterium carnipullorum]